jgi:hypothetical protein
MDGKRAAYPGADLIEAGLRDLARGARTVPALLVLVGAPRLERLGIRVPHAGISNPEHELYAALAGEDPDAAHSRYNALVRRLVSFERAAECGA